MGPKTNSKAQAAREAKSEREADKKSKANAAKEAADAEEWSKGAKADKGVDKAAKAAAAREAKAARDAALAAEEASISPKPKPAPKAGSKPAKKPSAVAAVIPQASGSGTNTPRLSSVPGTPKRGDIPSFENALHDPIESFSASNIDDALELLTLVNEKQDKASIGSKAAQLDSHPERRYKAAFAAYKERELPNFRKDYPGLRLQQYEEHMFKAFKKSPENPFNQVNVAFDATKEEKVEALRKVREETERRLRDET